MGITCAIHTNPNLRHQITNAAALRAGFNRHGIDAIVTASRTAQADLHVCLGNWYALRENQNCFYIDRAFWGDPDSLSLCWLVDGVKQFDWGEKPPRPHPELMPIKPEGNTVILCDYGMDGRQEAKIYPRATIRRHPAERPSPESLGECLRAHSKAVGRHTTALVDAAIQGLTVESTAPDSPLEGLSAGRERWINCIAWHNWTVNEIESGAAWQHLSQR